MNVENNRTFSAIDRLKLYSNRQLPMQQRLRVENQLSQKFNPNLITRNSEYFTHLENYLTIQNSFTEAKIDCLSQVIDPGSLCKSIVQVVYLLQVCYIFKMKLYLGLNLYTEKGRSPHNVQVFQLFCFEAELESLTTDKEAKQSVLNDKFIRVFDQTQYRMEDFLLVLQKVVTIAQVYIESLTKNSKPQSTSHPQNQTNRKHIQQFIEVYQNIITPQMHRFQEPKSLIKLLQQTKLFRSHSFLVKIINSSLFYSMKLHSTGLIDQLKFCVQHFRQFFRHSCRQLKFEKPVIKIIDQFFTNLCRANVIEVTKSLKEVHKQDDNSKEVLSLFQYDEETLAKYPTVTASILIPEKKCLKISSELLEGILNGISFENFPIDKDNPSQKSLQFQVSYTYVRNQIRIKCITEIDVPVDNVDYLNYMMSVFNSEMKSSIVVDTIQKFRKSITKRIEKVISFKLFYRAQYYQQPLTKILELIDVAVLAARIFTAELNKKSFIKLEDYEKRCKICQTFRHYENIFRNVLRKKYADILNEISS